MIVLTILVYAAFLEGVSVPAIAFILGAMFDLAVAEEVFS